MKPSAVLLLALGLSTPLLCAQQVPGLISYQGRVLDSSGNGIGTGTPVNRKIIFRLFDAATGGNRLWSEEQTVTLANGEFSVMLGQGVGASYNGSPENPRPSLLSVFGGTDRFLEVVVDNGDGNLNTSDVAITPRQRLTSTAFAIRAAVADGVALNTDLSLRDSNHGLGWYGTGRTFGGINVDGPVLYGWSGGALGSNQNGTLNTAIRWDSGGRVGLGGIAANPGYTLDVNGSGHFSTNLFVDGNLGIGNAAPERKLHLGNYGNGDMFMRISTAGGHNYRAGIEMRHFNDDHGFSVYHDERTAQGHGLHFAGSYFGTVTDRMFISTTSGNVGIGTISPQAKLDVVGPIRTHNASVGAPDNSAGGGAGMRLVLWPGHDSLATPFGMGIDNSTLYSVVPNTASHKWYGGTAERMSLNGSSGVLTLTGGLSMTGGIQMNHGIKMTGGFEVDSSFGGSSGNFISFGHPGFSEDYLGYAANTFYFRDSPGGGDSTHPNVAVSGEFVSGDYAIGGDRFMHVRTVGGNQYRSGLNLHHHDGNWGWSVFSDERTTGNGYGFHIESIQNGVKNSRLFIDNDGNMKNNGKPVPVAEEQLRIVRGNVSNSGAILQGSGFTVVKLSDGNYTVTMSTGFSGVPSVTLSPLNSGDREAAQVATITTSSFAARIRNASNGDSTNHGFSFIAVGPR